MGGKKYIALNDAANKEFIVEKQQQEGFSRNMK